MEYPRNPSADSSSEAVSPAEPFRLPPVQCYEYDVDKICPRSDIVKELVLSRAITLRQKYGTERTHSMIWRIRTGSFADILSVARDIDHLQEQLRAKNPTEVPVSTGSFYWNVLAQAWGVPVQELATIRLAGDLAYRFLVGGNRSESLGSGGVVFGGGSFFNSDDDAEPFVHVVPGLKEGETEDMAEAAIDYLRDLGVETYEMYSYKTKRQLAEEAEAEQVALFTERNRREVQENLRNKVAAFLKTLETESKKILHPFETKAQKEMYQRLDVMPGEDYNAWYRRVIAPDRSQDGMRATWHTLLYESNRRDARSFEEIIQGLSVSYAMKNSESFGEIYDTKSHAKSLLYRVTEAKSASSLIEMEAEFKKMVRRIARVVEEAPIQVSSSRPQEIPNSPERSFALRQRIALVQAIRGFLYEVYLANKEKQKLGAKSFRDAWNTLSSKLQSHNLNESALEELRQEIASLKTGDPINQRIHTTNAIETTAFDTLKGASILLSPTARKEMPRVIELLDTLNRVIDQQSPEDQEKIRASTLFTRDGLLPIVKEILSGAQLDYEELLLPFV